MLELFQAEWCPASRRVRQRLTELGLDYVNRQVPVERDERRVLLEATGADTIPVLVLENGSAVVGENNILAHLGEHYVDSEASEGHRRKAAQARARYLEEECGCMPTLQPDREQARQRTWRERKSNASVAGKGRAPQRYRAALEDGGCIAGEQQAR
jgi:glutathione S-transferase